MQPVSENIRVRGTLAVTLTSFISVTGVTAGNNVVSSQAGSDLKNGPSQPTCSSQ